MNLALFPLPAFGSVNVAIGGAGGMCRTTDRPMYYISFNPVLHSRGARSSSSDPEYDWEHTVYGAPDEVLPHDAPGNGRSTRSDVTKGIMPFGTALATVQRLISTKTKERHFLSKIKGCK